MATIDSVVPPRLLVGYQQWARDVQLGVQNLLVHGLRSLLTMLGMIFGVAAVVAMLSIGAGARQKVMALIEQMGVHNLIVEAKETMEWQAHDKIRRISPGLTLKDFRVINDDLNGVVASTPRKRLTPSKLLPKPQQDMPAVMGVNPNYQQIAGLHLVSGRFFDQSDEDHAAPVCVLGAAAKWSLFGSANPLGQYVKVNEQWFRVIGVVSPQLSAQGDSSATTVDVNNNIYIPLQSAFLRLEDSYSEVKDEIDGMYLSLADTANISEAAQVVRAVLDSSHHGADWHDEREVAVGYIGWRRRKWRGSLDQVERLGIENG
jgi:putative ABC transport system permease protein